MTNQTEAIQSGARRVEEAEHLAAGLSQPKSPATHEIAPEDGSEVPNLKTAVTGMTLSMFAQGSSIRVRVGNANNASEFYEHAFDSADEANQALLDAGILTAAQVPDPTQPAGTGIALSDVAIEQLESAGLKRHSSSTL